jgi:hypothetical protein
MDFFPSGATSRACTDWAEPWTNPWNVAVTPITRPSIAGMLIVEGYDEALPLPGRPISAAFRTLSTAALASELPKLIEPPRTARVETINVTVSLCLMATKLGPVTRAGIGARYLCSPRGVPSSCWS